MVEYGNMIYMSFGDAISILTRLTNDDHSLSILCFFFIVNVFLQPIHCCIAKKNAQKILSKINHKPFYSLVFLVGRMHIIFT